MLIVGQNKKYVCNLEKANGISITDLGQYSRSSYSAEIVIRFNKENIVLGQYENVERAIEILEDLLKTYTNWKKNVPGLNNPIYRMPNK